MQPTKVDFTQHPLQTGCFTDQYWSPNGHVLVLRVVKGHRYLVLDIDSEGQVERSIVWSHGQHETISEPVRVMRDDCLEPEDVPEPRARYDLDD